MSTVVLSLVRRGEVWSGFCIDWARTGAVHPSFVRSFLGGDPERFARDEAYRAELTARIPPGLVKDAEAAQRERHAAIARGEDWQRPSWSPRPQAVIRPTKEAAE